MSLAKSAIDRTSAGPGRSNLLDVFNKLVTLYEKELASGDIYDQEYATKVKDRISQGALDVSGGVKELEDKLDELLSDPSAGQPFGGPENDDFIVGL